VEGHTTTGSGALFKFPEFLGSTTNVMTVLPVSCGHDTCPFTLKEEQKDI